MAEDAFLEPWRTIERIHDAWLEGRPEDLYDLFDEDVTMALPGFAGYVGGAESMVAGFREMVDSARVHNLEIGEPHVHQASGTAVVTFTFETVYEQEGTTFHSSGRDLWVLAKTAGGWKAVWRTLLDVTEEPVPAPA